MRRDPWSLLLAVPAILGLWVIAQVTTTWAGRVAYPYDLEWMEGGVLAHAWRVQQGLPVYDTPSPDWIPMVYTPGYYGVVAALGTVFGLSLPLARVVSIFGTTAAALALVWVAHRRARQPLAGLIGAAVYLGCYNASGGFYDIVRPEALAVGLLAWSLALATEDDDRLHVVAGLLLAAAFAMKHNTAAFGLPVALGLWAWRGWRSGMRYGLAAAIPGLLLTVWWQVGSAGHFLTYVVEVPRSHPFVEARALPGTVDETGRALPFITAMLPVWAMAWGARSAPKIPRWLHVVLPALGAVAAVWWIAGMDPARGIPPAPPWKQGVAAAALGGGGVSTMLVVAGAIWKRRLDGPWALGTLVVLTGAVVAGIMRAHHGGFLNVYMPFHLVLSGALVFLMIDLLRTLPGWRGALLATAVGLAQVYDKSMDLDLDRLVPTEQDREAGDAVVAALREVEGPVLAPFSSWIPAQAGHAPGMHLISLWDLNHKDGPYRPDVDRIRQSFRNHHYGAVLDAKRTMGYGILQSYEEARTIPMPRGALMPKTGWRRRPEVLLVPKEGTPSPRRRRGAQAEPGAGR